jgi:ATP-dependent Clp protease adaptor protein ClpS
MPIAAWSALHPGTEKPPILVLEESPQDQSRRDEPVRVVLHNDDYTPAEYVVGVLERHFGFGWWRATWIMSRAHFTGQAIVGHYPRREAEERVAAAHGHARADGWPLRLSVEQD